MRDWRASEFHYAWVYPHEGEYVLSNDYVIWAAAERSQVDHLHAGSSDFRRSKKS